MHRLQASLQAYSVSTRPLGQLACCSALPHNCFSVHMLLLTQRISALMQIPQGLQHFSYNDSAQSASLLCVMRWTDRCLMFENAFTRI